MRRDDLGLQDPFGAFRQRIQVSLVLGDVVEQEQAPEGAANGSVVKFAAVKTDGLRIEAQMQPNVSGGILECRVK